MCKSALVPRMHNQGCSHVAAASDATWTQLRIDLFHQNLRHFHNNKAKREILVNIISQEHYLAICQVFLSMLLNEKKLWAFTHTSMLKVNPYMPPAICPVQFLVEFFIRVPKLQSFTNLHVSCIKLILEECTFWYWKNKLHDINNNLSSNYLIAQVLKSSARIYRVQVSVVRSKLWPGGEGMLSSPSN